MGTARDEPGRNGSAFCVLGPIQSFGDRGKSFQLLDAPGVGVSKNFHVLLPSGKRP